VVPDTCPVCGGQTQVKTSGEVLSLYCINEDCQVKKLKSFSHLVSRNALNVDGFSEATLEKFIGKGFIHQYSDIFHLSDHKDEIVVMEGFGEKSYSNFIQSIENARNTNLSKVIYSLGIPNIGLAGAKLLCKEFQFDFEKLIGADTEELSSVPGVGGVIAASFKDYFLDEGNLKQVKNLLAELTLTEEVQDENQLTLSGMNFVITGSLFEFENRDSLKDLIEKKGGKVTGSVTSKTHSLINNDATSNSSKNKTAKDLNVPIITEREFMEKYVEI
jgi:DNA ligase (NAD+)